MTVESWEAELGILVNVYRVMLTGRMGHSEIHVRFKREIVSFQRNP